MGANPLWKIILVLIAVAIIFSFFGGERGHPQYAIGIVKEKYDNGASPLSRALQASLTIAFNDFFSQHELGFSLEIEFIPFNPEKNNLEEKIQEFLESDWKVLALIGSTDTHSTATTEKLAVSREIPLLSPFFPVSSEKWSFSLVSTPAQLAQEIEELLAPPDEQEPFYILGTHPLISGAELQEELQLRSRTVERLEVLPENHREKTTLILDFNYDLEEPGDRIFINPPTLEPLSSPPEKVKALVHHSLLAETSGHLSFREDYRENTGQNPPYYAYNAYDALYLILDILKAAGREPPDMQKSFQFYSDTLLGGEIDFTTEGKLHSVPLTSIEIQPQGAAAEE